MNETIEPIDQNKRVPKILSYSIVITPFPEILHQTVENEIVILIPFYFYGKLFLKICSAFDIEQ
jgi:hypothetical protein